MPKTKRDLLKRQLAHGYANCHRAIEHIAAVHTPFSEQHPDMATALETAIQSIIIAADILEKFAAQAWLMSPDEIIVWRNVRDREGSDNDA